MGSLYSWKWEHFLCNYIYSRVDNHSNTLAKKKHVHNAEDEFVVQKCHLLCFIESFVMAIIIVTLRSQ